MALNIRLDTKTKFPLIHIPPLDAYVQWLPVTKIQIEYFLSSIPDSTYDAQWYSQIMRDNPRVSPRRVRRNNYWNLIATNVLPRDANRFAGWMGRGYRLLEADEWLSAYRYVRGMDASQDAIKQIVSTEGLHQRTRSLIAIVEKATGDAYRAYDVRTMAHQMLMLEGVMEYVYTDDSHNEYGGLGSTHPDFFSSMAEPDSGMQYLANPTEGTRMKHYGFRLMWKE